MKNRLRLINYLNELKRCVADPHYRVADFDLGVLQDTIDDLKKESSHDALES